MFKLNKRAQISMFVIIGAILVIVTAFLFINGKYDLFVSHDTKIKNQVSRIVEDCIYDSASRGAFLLGYQGGYIEVPPQVAANPFAYTDLGMKIPNWDTERGDVPTIASMQVELDNFISDQSRSCISYGLKGLENAFDLKPQGELEVDSRINDHNIVIESNYLINFNEKNSDETLTVSDYLVRLDGVRLGELYNLAVQIYNAEAENYFMENLVIDQIRTADDYSSKESMPTEGMTLSCGERIWTLPQLKSNLANLNNHNFKYLQFEGTMSKEGDFAMTFNDEIMPAKDRVYYDRFYRVPLEEVKPNYENYDVEVFMPSTEINGKKGYLKSYPFRTFEVTPSSGQVVKSIRMEVDAGINIPIPCIQVFHHLYKLDYDLIVKLKDYSEDSNGYFFQFPLRIQITNNEPKETQVSIIVPEPRTLNQQSYCSEDSVLYPMMVVTRDNQGNPLDGVNVSYKCINLKCNIGHTEKPTFQGVVRQHAAPELIADFPFCYNGQVIGEKEGYHKGTARANTDTSLLRREAFVGDNLVELELTPLKSFDVDAETFLIKHMEDGTGKRVLTEDDGSIYISLEDKGKDFESVALWPNEEGYLDKIEFLDDEDAIYNLSIFYMNSEQGLAGMFQIQNWTPNIHAGNTLQFLIPGSKGEIIEDDYLSFYEYMKSKQEDPEYIPRFY